MNFQGAKSKLFLCYVVMNLRVTILRFLSVSSVSILKTLKIKKNEKNYCKKLVFAKKNHC